MLAVDDDPAVCALIEEILLPPQFEITTVRSSIEAWTQIEASAYDVVLLDRNMPGVNGDALCQQIRAEHERHMLPIVMMTGGSPHDALPASLASGATDFIRKPFSVSELTARVTSAATTKRLTDQMERAEVLLLRVARLVEKKDSCTGDHCSRLAQYGKIFGRALKLSDAELHALSSGAVLHDIGKIAIPDHILLKPGRLDPSEEQIMRSHTVIGADLCAELRALQLAVPIVRHHHERWDGSGYPDGLQGAEIPYLARIFQLTDVYDALTTQRPYKDAWPMERAANIIHEEMKRDFYDPELTRCFLRLLSEQADQFAAINAGGVPTSETPNDLPARKQ